MEIKRSTIENFSYEIIERISRFISHLDEIKFQFYENEANSLDKIDLLNNYKDSLFKLLQTTIYSYNEKYNEQFTIDNHFKILRKVLDSINNLHSEWLSILPRPSETVELDRFKRVIYKQIIQLKNNSQNQDNISISINESIGEQVNLDPLSDFKLNNINSLLDEFNKSIKSSQIEKFKDDLSDDEIKQHITIPRIDASNTYRWSSLIHEMSHTLMKDVKFGDENDIEKDFLKFVENNSLVSDFFNPINQASGTFTPDNNTLKSWLIECWCDLFACILIGPSLYFSQYLVFLNEIDNNNNRTHPPSTLRLFLIESILMGRFPKDLFDILEKDYISSCEELINSFQDKHSLNFETNNELIQIGNFFQSYFKTHFFTSDDSIGIEQNESLNIALKKLVNKYVNIHTDVIVYLKNQLNQGLPIPSIKTINEKDEYEEISTYIQEIFLASWISRCEVLMKTVLENIKDIDNSTSINEIYEKSIEPNIKRHDQAVLKSIQVSEWFDFFTEEKQRPEKINIYTTKSQPDITKFSSILVDSEIESLVLSDELKIIPIMNLKGQTGTTSIDIRLGTSFQLYFPDQYGLVDFTEDNTDNAFKAFSRRINLDFMKGITITPGQFMLGHSMEYIKLPNYICGCLEGRSSFARLGIEIHMTAGFIDPGFEGVITFEIYNAGANTVKLYPGLRIGQLRFERNNIPAIPYHMRRGVKYKGLLEHNVSRQNRDIEIELIKKSKKKI
jgi:dCTP deaminase